MTSAPLHDPHHDGSALYVLDAPDELGGEATVRLRVPRERAAGAVALRYLHDGEPRGVQAEVDCETETDTWWRATFPVLTPDTRYRWLVTGGDFGYAWVNGGGVVPADVPDADDFVLSLDRGGPDWHLSSVVYEIFPDRFASSGLGVEPPSWAVRRAWDELPTGRGPATPCEWFGGDLRGIEQRLDHVERLGANAIYMTPVFPAGSTHRYDASSFDTVDPLLGGDEALAALARAASGRGIRLVGDLTTNHCGERHPWFQAALAAPDAPERSFFYFDDALPNGYECWLGVPSLPKLDWRSPELRERMTAIVGRRLGALDGWRIDVAHMTGRYRDLDPNHEVARLLRAAGGDALLVAEHGHDYRDDLRSGGWHGAMNYAGFLRPAWTWLRGDDLPEDLRSEFWGVPAGLPRLDGVQAATTMRAFRAGVPWQAVLHSWPLLDSHDTARFRTVARSPERHLVGIGLQMTTPGVPMVFAGDELGLEGAWGEDARRTMPWGRPESWDTGLLEAYRWLIALRRSEDALARGGIRYVFVGAETIAYLRETPHDRLLCLASRSTHAPVRLPLGALGCSALETLYGGDATIAAGAAVLPAGGPAFHVWRLA